MPTVYTPPWFLQQFFDSNGDPLDSGYIETKYAGTSDDKTTYSDSEGTTPNANPVVLDSAGMCSIFLLSGAYDFYVYDSGDNLISTITGINAQTATTDVNTVDDLRALSAGATSVVRTLGYSAVNDGGGWLFYWDSTSTAADDGGMVIQPDSLPATGRWIGVLPQDGELDLKTYGAACDGTTDDITELQACDTYCAANALIILISDHTYFSTDPSLSSKIKLLPSCQLRWGNINPTLDVVIDGNDSTQHFNCSATYVPTLNVNEIYADWFGETWSSDPGVIPITTAAIAAISGSKSKMFNNIRLHSALWDLEVSNLAEIQELVVGSPSGGAKGGGTINAVAVYDDNVLLTGYVLDKAFNPDYSLEEWKNKTPDPAALFDIRSSWIFDINQYFDFVKSRRMLPTFDDIESSGNIPSTGAMIQKLWEVVEIQSVHINQLNDRIKKLEGK